jgi:5-(carboxyamino)imidazole ribonucleotide synthase
MPDSLPPGSTLGILGGGQLGRMLAMAAARLGIRCLVLSPEDDPPAADVAEHLCADYADPAALAELARRADVVTYEFENVDAEAAEHPDLVVRPGPRALKVAQDRLFEKEMLAELGLPTAPWREVQDGADVTAAFEEWGPCVAKTRRFGYDGKGQVVVRDRARAESAWSELGGKPAIVEGWVEFDCEASVILARGLDGQIECFDLARNHHEDNILATSTVPAELSDDTREQAVAAARAIAEHLDYVGVIGVELFVSASGIRVNEIAPRVHNSGHWTTDACVTSQFEQHVRAVMGWPLGSTRRHSDAVMENLIGGRVHDWPKLAAQADVAVHLYRKAKAREGRKMGHITRVRPRSG